MKNLLLALAVTALVSPSVFACNDMQEFHDAMRQAQADMREARMAEYSRAKAEARVVIDLLERHLLTLAYFPGVFEPREGDVDLPIGGERTYQAVSVRHDFLRGAPGTFVLLRQADRAGQIAALKADYISSLSRAAEVLRGLDMNPGEDRSLTSLADWGIQSVIRTNPADGVAVLSQGERATILRAPERDPHE